MVNPDKTGDASIDAEVSRFASRLKATVPHPTTEQQDLLFVATCLHQLALTWESTFKDVCPAYPDRLRSARDDALEAAGVPASALDDAEPAGDAPVSITCNGCVIDVTPGDAGGCVVAVRHPESDRVARVEIRDDGDLFAGLSDAGERTIACRLIPGGDPLIWVDRDGRSQTMTICEESGRE